MSNSSPVLDGLITNVVFAEQLVNAAAQLLDTNVNFTDVDGNFTGGTLTVSGLLPEDSVGIRNEGTGAGQIAVTGSDIRFGNVIVASFTGGAAGTQLVVTFSANVTSPAIDALIQNLTYANSSNTPIATRDLVITIQDAAGAAAIPPTSFAEQTGISANPFDGIDVGVSSTPRFADLDGDGDLDAMIGANDGTLRYYRNTGTALGPVFVEQTGSDNPFNGVDVGTFSNPSFADLDGDGDLDAMIGANDGTLRYFRNTATALAPVFVEQTGSDNPFNGVDLGTFSTPAFADLDGDGDLDAVIGEAGGTLRYYRNTGTALAPVFVEQIGLANPFDGVDVGSISTPAFADLDGDGDLDALFGENLGLLNYFRNIGTALAPIFVEQTGSDNPFNGVDVGANSSLSLADLDGDGDLDAVIGEAEGTINCFLNNEPPTSTGAFVEQTGAANPFNGVDVDFSSTPSFADLDGDGDLDALIGENNGVLNYYRNTGTALAPVFTEQVGAANPFNGVSPPRSTPTFADLDGDGDLDAVIGRNEGSLNYFRNTGTVLAPVFTQQIGAAHPFDGVDVGDNSAPSFADLDGDGDLDAVIGESDGVLNYYRNTGTALAPVFVRQTGTANPFNGVDVGSFGNPSLADLDGDGDLDALIGKNDGTLIYYRNTGTSVAPVFNLQTGAANPFNGVDVGSFSAPSFADLDGDGDLDALIGEGDGTLKYYLNTGSGFVLTVNVTAQSENPFTTGNDVVNLNTLLASGGYFLPDVTNALDGNDNVTLSNTVNVGVAFDGGAGNDTLTGGTGNDVLVGGTGADSLNGGSSVDTVTFGGAARVIVNLFTGEGFEGEAAGDRYVSIENVIGTAQGDIAVGTVGGNFVDGVDGADLIYGNAGNDTLLGGVGADTVFGEADNDLVFGWLGADLLWGGDGNDTLWGEQDNDTLLGEAGNDVLLGIDGNDVMFGWVGNDSLFGWTGDDVLWGEQGDDLMLGEDGNDTFIGGLGRDTMTGGQGADRFFNAVSEIAAGEVDLITDFDAADRYLFQTGAQIQYFNFNAPGYGTGAGIHVQVQGGVFILDVFGANASQLQAQTLFF